MQITLPTSDVLCVYGLPDHELYTELTQWLEENSERYLLILEDDERALIRQPSHERIRLCNCTYEEMIKKTLWEFVFLTFDFLKVPGNSLKDSEKMERAFAKCAYFQQGIHLVASDFEHRGIPLISNFLKNSSLFPHVRRGEDLFGKFSGVPAIICGAGPSLEKEISHLKNLKDKALIFAGGTALTSLSQYGVLPHFGGGLDPHPPKKRLFEHLAFEVPFFFQTRVHPKPIKQMQGPLLWISGGQNDLFDQGKFEGGWNISTFLVGVAYHLGCNPIILVGVDLAQEQEKAYAGGITREEEGKLISLENGKFSRRDWLFAASWLSDFSKKHPQIDWYNASEGIEIGGFNQKKLSEFVFDQERDLEGLIHSMIESIALGITREIDGESIQKSLLKVSTLCDEILELLEKIFPNSPEKSGEYALLKMEMEKEVVYKKFVTPVWEIWKHVFSRQIPRDIPVEYGIELNQWLFIKGICEDARKI